MLLFFLLSFIKSYSLLVSYIYVCVMYFKHTHLLASHFRLTPSSSNQFSSQFHIFYSGGKKVNQLTMVTSKFYFIGFYVFRQHDIKPTHKKTSNKAHSLQTSTNIVLSSYFNCFFNFYNVYIYFYVKSYGQPLVFNTKEATIHNIHVFQNCLLMAFLCLVNMISWQMSSTSCSYCLPTQKAQGFVFNFLQFYLVSFCDLPSLIFS